MRSAEKVLDRLEHVLTVRSDCIPEELRARHQWVAWRLEERKGEVTKVPYTPRTGCRASSTDLMTWSTFEKVLEAYESGKRYDGIGFVFCSGDPYVGVDLDGCVGPETGEIAPWAVRIIDALDSYAELSPSGRGVHIIARGKIPAGGRRGPVEVYRQDRFFTVTGHILGGAR